MSLWGCRNLWTTGSDDVGGSRYRGSMRDDKLLTRIGGLLRQAEGTENEHEAEAFMAAAQRLATAASIDLALARAHDPAARKATAPITRQITVGKAGKRGLRTYVQLFVQIAQANDVTCDVASNSTFVIAYGFETDIDTCEALYTSLVIQMVAASDAYLKSGAYKGETARQVVTKNVGYLRRRVVEEKALSPITAIIWRAPIAVQRSMSSLTSERPTPPRCESAATYTESSTQKRYAGRGRYWLA